MSSTLNISGGASNQAYDLYARSRAEQQGQGASQPSAEAAQQASQQAAQQTASLQPQLSAPGAGNPAQAGPSPFIGLVQGPPPGAGTAAQQLAARPLLAGGHAEKNHQATQATGSAGSTPTIATYGVTAVTAINGTSGTNLDLLA